VTSATIAGSIRDDAGAAVSGAVVSAVGPTTAKTQTSADGSFSLTVPAGIYRVKVTKNGYLDAAVSDFTAVAGTTTPFAVTLSQPSLSSLQTIGRVTSQGGVSQINTGTAVSNRLSAEDFAALGSPQINDVLQHDPDVTIQRMGSQPDTTIIVGAVQPYETQVLIDGHPVALGQYGVWLSEYYPSYLIGGVETQSGPGNTTPFANLAVGGTANLLTPAFTRANQASFTQGADNYGTQFSHFSASGSIGRLQYVVGVGIDGANGPYSGTTKCLVNPDAGGANSQTSTQSFGIIQTCSNADGSFYSKGLLGKLKYEFSPVTSLSMTFNGAWGGYAPIGLSQGLALGQQTIEPCLQSNPLQCTSPQFANLIGKTISGYSWYPGYNMYNNQDMWDAEFRTSLGSTTLLVRPYVGSIEPSVTFAVDPTYYPQSYSPPGTVGNAAQTAAFNDNCTNNLYGSTTSPSGAVTSFSNGQLQCYVTQYSTFELDKFYGSTFSLIHPFGSSTVALNYDYHGQSTFAYVNDPSGISVPFSTDRYSTFSLTSNLEVLPRVGIAVGLYNTTWTVNGVKPFSTSDASLVDFTRSISRFDPHVALTFRPSASTSVRAAWGTSATFPFIGQVSGLATYQVPASTLGPPYALGGILTEKNANLEPEVSLAYSLGADHRFANGAVISGDLTETIVHNVFETLTTSIPMNGGLEGIFSPINVAKLDSKVASLKYKYAPRSGFGYNIAASAVSTQVSGIPPGAYSAGTASFPVNNVQICGNGFGTPGIPTCIPYLKGYGQLTYTWRDRTFMALGVDYEGKNNAYFQLPMALVDFSFRKPITKNLSIQLSAENLLNTNNYGNYLPSPNSGTPLVAGTVDATGAIQQTSYTPTRNSASPRTVYLNLNLHVGQ
jgi:hypothetical protein